jgi:hypothetical protein
MGDVDRIRIERDALGAQPRDRAEDARSIVDFQKKISTALRRHFSLLHCLP